jgi:nucleoside 2-deoxyribosyltransferase
VGYLNKKTVYLAGPIMSLNCDGKSWRGEITPKLKSFGLEVLDPTRKTTHGCSEVSDDKAKFKKLAADGDYFKLKEEFSPVARWDLRSVDKSDFIIVSFNFAIPTFGTIDEIVVASTQRKPILFHFDKSQTHLFNPWTTVRIHPNCIFNSWDDIFKLLKDVDDGNYDTKYWTL